MSPIRLFGLFLVGLSLFAQSPHKQRTVIVISLDGFPAYALQDARLPVPTLRQLMKEGASAESMQPINPTVTWPNHTAMITGVNAAKHQVLFNGLLTHPANEPVKIEPWRDKDQMVRAKTVYDAAFEAGLTTAQVDWVAIYNARTITWEFPERPNPDGTIERELVTKGVVTRDQLEHFNASAPVWRDQIWTDAAAHILEQKKPNLMLFHLLALDTSQHHYGPMSVGGTTAMAFLDDRVKQIIDSVRASKRLNRTTFLIVSDHGFRNVQHTIHPNVLLSQQGLVKRENNVVHCQAWVVPEGGTAMVYINDPNRRRELVSQLHGLFEKVEGVAHVYGQNEYQAIGLPVTAASDQSPDLLLAAKPGYAFGGGDSGELVTPLAEGGSHGYMNTDPNMQAIFIAWGAGIRGGVHLPPIQNRDVASTIAQLLGLQWTGDEGHVLRSILK